MPSLTEADRQALHGRVGTGARGARRRRAEPGHLRRCSPAISPPPTMPPRRSSTCSAPVTRPAAIYADQEAIRHYRRAREFLARLGDDRRSRETLFKIALVHHLAFDFAEAESAYDEAFACKAEPFEQPAPTERLVTALLRPNSLAPASSTSPRRARSRPTCSAAFSSSTAT